MKRTICILLVLITLLSLLPVTALALTHTGKCGDNAYWRLNESNGVLTISGTGEMTNFSNIDTVPWYDLKDYIKTLVVEDGITSIGKYAFYRCTKMTAAELPDTLKYIGYDSFSCCFALSDLELPESLAYIDRSAFYWCTALPSVTIPGSVTVLNEEVFYHCTSLKTVKLGRGIRTIGDGAFGDCTALEKIDIPSTVTTIKDFAFRNTALTSVVIPNTVTTFEGRVFWECSKLQSVVLPNTIPEISSAMFYNCYALKSVSIPDTVKRIGSDAFYYCRALSDVYFGGTQAEWNSIVVEDDPYTTQDLVYLQNAKKHYQNVEPTGLIELQYNGKTYDLLSQTVSLEEGSAAQVQVRVNYEGAEKVWLSQTAADAVALEAGVWTSITPGKLFKPGREIYLLFVNEQTGDAKTRKTRLEIMSKASDSQVMPDGDVGGLNFSLFGDNKLTIPEDVAIFGGTEIDWKLDFIPVSFEYDREDKNKINVVFGTTVAEYDSEEDELKYFTDFDFDDYKEKLKKAAENQKQDLSKLCKEFKMEKKPMGLMGDRIIGAGEGDKDLDIDIAGYAIMKRINGNWTFVEGKLCANLDVSLTYNGQLFIWVVPICYEIGADFGAGIEGYMVDVSPETFKPELEAYITAKIGAHLGAGLGVAKVASVGVAGKGSLNLKTATHETYLKVWGEGEADFNVKVLGKEVAKKTFAKGDFLVYETGNPDGMIKADGVQTAALGLYSSVRNTGVYENESRDYLENPSEWYGMYPPISLLAMDYSNKNLQMLAENVYTEAAPIVCEIDGQKVMVMLWDDEDRADIDRTMLVWSVYDEESCIWSEPAAVHNDGTADFYPSFRDGWVVWQNQKSTMTDTMTLAEIAALGEVYAAKWNGAGFDEPVAVTDNDTMDSQPAVCAGADNVTVAWVTNTENDILGMTGDNAVMMCLLGDAVQTVAQGLPAVTDLAAACVDGQVHIAYVTDCDSDLQTVEDWELYLNGEQLTDNDVLDSNPVFVGNDLYYYSGGNVLCRDLTDGSETEVFDTAASGVTDAFTAASNEAGHTAIWWSSAVEGGTEIFTTLNTDGSWSDVIQLTEAGNQSRYPTGILEEDGSMVLALCNSIWEDGEIVQSDLYTLQVTPSYDLALENVYIDESSMTVYATVKNGGELAVDGFAVTVSDTQENNCLTVTEPLKAGASAEVEIAYLLPENMTQRQLTIAISAEEEEYNLENNTAMVTAGNCDVAVTAVEHYELVPKTVAVATVSNLGYADSGEVTVHLRKGAADGEILQSQRIASLAVGQSAEVSFTYRADTEEEMVFFVTAQTDMDEMSAGNNDAYYISSYMNTVNDYLHEIVYTQQGTDALLVSAYAENNTNVDLNGKAALFVYGADGALQTTVSQDVTVPAFGGSDILYTLDGVTLEEGSTMQLALCEEMTVVSGEHATHTLTADCVCGEAVAVEESCIDDDGDELCDVCAGSVKVITKVTVIGSNMLLDNDLRVNFIIPNLPSGTDYMAYVYQDGKDGEYVHEVPSTAWADYGSVGKKISVTVRAKEMADDLKLVIKDEEGNVYNHDYTTSVREYANKALTSTTKDTLKVLVVDMVNYGAAAQTKFNYKKDDLANRLLTEAQKALATPEVSCTDNRVKGKNYYGSNLNLENKIDLNLFFANMGDLNRSEMWAEVSFTDYNGIARSSRVEGSDFVFYKTTIYKVPVTTIVVADAKCPVTVTVYNADGTVFGSGTDSVESYVARGIASDSEDVPLYKAIIKFTASAYHYLTTK